MNFISDAAKRLLSASVQLLNQPAIKEGVKNVAGTATLVFGLVEIYQVYRDFSTKSVSQPLKWTQVAQKIVIASARISLILSAGVSRPGVMIIAALVGSVFSTEELTRVFGPNTTFVINPWHPRHVVSIAAVLLALPFVIQSLYKTWNEDTGLRSMTLFNTITSRPVLHLGNQLSRFILRNL